MLIYWGRWCLGARPGPHPRPGSAARGYADWARALLVRVVAVTPRPPGRRRAARLQSRFMGVLAPRGAPPGSRQSNVCQWYACSCVVMSEAWRVVESNPWPMFNCKRGSNMGSVSAVGQAWSRKRASGAATATAGPGTPDSGRLHFHLAVICSDIHERGEREDRATAGPTAGRGGGMVVARMLAASARTSPARLLASAGWLR